MNINELLKSMTFEQKVAQLFQCNVAYLRHEEDGNITGLAQELDLTKEQISSVGSTLNFPGAVVMIDTQKEHLEDDPNKIPLLFMQDVVHGYKTIFPIPLGMGATFDTELVEKCYEMSSEEMAAGGVHVTFAPMVDLVRDSRWGRCMESTGEDPYLNEKMARAMVRGIQKSGKVASCVKHFAAYGQTESGRDYNVTDMSERMLRDYYLKAYKAAVDEGVEMVMTSFNLLNGVPAAGNKWLVKDILRDEWGFDKVVISDYNSFAEMKIVGYCETHKDCAQMAMDATGDIEMMSTCYIKNLKALVDEGKITEKQIDDAVLRIFKLKEKLGLFDNPYTYADAEKEKELCLCEEHCNIVRVAAEKSAVLLKNDGVLPFDKNSVKRVAVMGPFAQKIMNGNWACHGRSYRGVNAFDGIKNLLPEAEVLYSEGCTGKLNETDCSMIQDAVEKAKESDAVILCLGEASHDSGEARSRAELRLSHAQKTLIREVVKVNKNTAVVLFNGRPLVLTDIIDDIPALADIWQPGTEGGTAIAKLLFGEVNFSGKLPMTFPRSEGQLPMSYNSYRAGKPEVGDFSCGYIDMSMYPLYPFGYGLSYTDFEFSAPRISSSEMERGGSVEVSVDVKNVGAMEGDTVVQMYIRDDYSSIVRPNKELKGYKKISLKPQESQTVSFEITEDLLTFWSKNEKFEAESGSFTVWLSDSSIVKDELKFNLK